MSGDSTREDGSADRTDAGVQSVPIPSNYKVLGEFYDANGAGVYGSNLADEGDPVGVLGESGGYDGSGTPIGVWGRVGTPFSGSGTPIGVYGSVPSNGGYGVMTPDDARIDGGAQVGGDATIDGDVYTTGQFDVLVDGDRVLRIENEDSGGRAGNVTLGHSANVNLANAGTISGGGSNSNPNVLAGDFNAIGGGRDNKVNSLEADDGTIGGGRGHRIDAPADYVTIGGGKGNSVATSGADYAAIGGGTSNAASDTGTTVGGGYGNRASGSYSTVGGGDGNTASGKDATVGGGQDNTAAGWQSAIGGGTSNYVTGRSTTVGGGYENTAIAEDSTVGGGSYNHIDAQQATVAGGEDNGVSGRYGTVGGGEDNAANGKWATVPGGRGNAATGDHSFAAGEWAHAADHWSFVWNDGSGASDSNGSSTDRFSSSTDDGESDVRGSATFNVKATNGVRFVTNTGNNSVTWISADSAGWSSSCTRSAKTNVEPVDPEAMLDGVESLSITTWEYEDEDGGGTGVRHVSPMAEEFADAFDVGESDTGINSINADGVAFAAIQGLSRRLDDARERLAERVDRIAELETETRRLREELADLRSLVERDGGRESVTTADD